VDEADVANVTEHFLADWGQQQGGVVWKGNERAGWETYYGKWSW